MVSKSVEAITKAIIEVHTKLELEYHPKRHSRLLNRERIGQNRMMELSSLLPLPQVC